jgi:hypothetical protein
MDLTTKVLPIRRGARRRERICSITARMTPDERGALEELARRYRWTASQTIVTLVRVARDEGWSLIDDGPSRARSKRH